MINSAIHRLRVDALHSLASRLTSEAGGLLADALDHLFGPTEARSGIAVLAAQRHEIIAEHGLSGSFVTAEVREAILGIASRSIEERRTLRLTDVRADRAGILNAGEIAALGCTAALAVPLLVRRQPLGAFVLTFAPLVELDEETALFVETVAALIAPSLGGTRDESARPSSAKAARPPSEGRALGGATLLGASVGHELEGPVGALALQLDEQRRIVSDLQIFSDGGDTPMGGALAELAELTDELAATVARLRETTDQLTRLGHRELAPSALDLADVARTACSVARPGFEERGILLETQLSEGGYITGHRESLLQVFSDLLAVTRDRAERANGTPKVIVRTANEGNRVVLFHRRPQSESGSRIAPRFRAPTLRRSVNGRASTTRVEVARRRHFGPWRSRRACPARADWHSLSRPLARIWRVGAKPRTENELLAGRHRRKRHSPSLGRRRRSRLQSCCEARNEAAPRA
ncbi:MAG: hypothetical protein QM784_15220 [Polyangiaceae bacterium]